MSLATFEDANAWLDEDKVKFADDLDALTEALQADRVVRAAVGFAFPGHVTLWDANPSGSKEATPEVLRTATGMLMASYRYAKKYSEETVKEPNYASRLRDTAFKLLTDIRDGVIALTDVDYDASTDSVKFDSSFFFPNDETGLLPVYDAQGQLVSREGSEDIRFRMGESF